MFSEEMESNYSNRVEISLFKKFIIFTGTIKTHYDVKGRRHY